MTTPSTRLTSALSTLHWSQRSLARIIGADERRVRRWAAGVYQAPEDVLVWLETLSTFHLTHPCPPRRGKGEAG